MVNVMERKLVTKKRFKQPRATFWTDFRGEKRLPQTPQPNYVK